MENESDTVMELVSAYFFWMISELEIKLDLLYIDSGLVCSQCVLPPFSGISNNNAAQVSTQDDALCCREREQYISSYVKFESILFSRNIRGYEGQMQY